MGRLWNNKDLQDGTSRFEKPKSGFKWWRIFACNFNCLKLFALVLKDQLKKVVSVTSFSDA